MRAFLWSLRTGRSSNLACLNAGISIGAIPDIWRSVVRDTFGTEPFSASEIHYRRLRDLPALPTNGATKGDLIPSGDEFVATEGRLEDVAEVSSSLSPDRQGGYKSPSLDYCLLMISCRSSRLPRFRIRPHISRHACPIQQSFVLLLLPPRLPRPLHPTSNPHHEAARSSHTVPRTATAQSGRCMSPPRPAGAGTARSSFSRARSACATSIQTTARRARQGRGRDTCLRTCTRRTSRVMR